MHGRWAGITIAATAFAIAAPAPALAQGPVSRLDIADAPAVVEGGPGDTHVASFTVTRSVGYDAVSANYQTSSGTAQNGVDFANASATVNFATGQNTAVINVTVTGDADVERDESFGVTLSSPSSGAFIGRATASGTITDDDGRPPGTHIDVADAPTVIEGSRSAFTLTLSNPATAPMSVHYATADGTAKSPADYTAASGDVTFAPGETSKTVGVDTIADSEFESDETFGLVLSAPSAAGIGRGSASATIANDPGQAPPPPHEHALLGTITYEPAFGVGLDGLGALGPFVNRKGRPDQLTVTLKAADGSAVATKTLTKADTTDSATGVAIYRFDGLGACTGCQVVLTEGPTVQDVRPVAFDGQAGQTDADLIYGRETQGGAVDGTVLLPVGARASDLTVVIRDGSGATLADTSRLRGCGTGGAGCPRAESYAYRLTGLPPAATPVTAVLMQADARAKRLEVDSADFTLDASGETRAPDLTAISDPPAAVKGRTLYGQINFRAPFAPGARHAGDLDVAPKDLRHLAVELRGPDDGVRARLQKFTRTTLGYTGYELHQLGACTGCTLALIEDKRIVSRTPVDLPAASPSVTRRDLNYAKAGDAEFIAGVVRAGGGNPRKLSVLVTDAATGERLAGSAETDRPCAASGKGGCPDAGDLAYRIGGAPAGRDVVLTLLSGTQALDSRRVQLEQAGVVTQAPALVVPYGAGPRSLQGHVLPAGPFGIGGEPTHWAKPVKLTARLLDQNETEVQRATVHATDRTELSDSFALGDLPACEGCTLELLDGGGIVQDRVPVTVRPDSPGVTVADLGYQQLPGGAYVQGKIVARRQTSPGKLRVQVLDAAGKVLADSDKVRTAGSGGGGGGGKSATRFDYRLGGIPRELGAVKVVVLGGKTKLASTNVTLAPGTADTNVPDLKVDVSGGGGKR